MSLQMRLRPKFPTQVRGQNGLSASVGGGVVTVTPSWGTLTEITSITAQARTSTFLLGYDTVGTPAHFRIATEALIATIDEGVNGAVASWSIGGNATSASAALSSFRIGSLTQKGSPASTDLVLIQDQASSGSLKYATVSAINLTPTATISGTTGGTDNAAIRADGSGTATVQGSALLIADTTGALSRSGGGGIPVEGTNTSDNAAVGYTGEWISTTVLSGSSVNLTSGAASNVTTLSVGPGDWVLDGVVASRGSPTTAVHYLQGSISRTTSVMSSNAGEFSSVYGGSATWFNVISSVTAPAPAQRLSTSATVTCHLVGIAGFGVSTMSIYGKINARRIR